MKKKILIHASLFLTLLGLFFAFSTGALAVSFGDYGDLSYMINDDGTVTITGYNGSGRAVVLPEEIEGKPVTVITRLKALFFWTECSDMQIFYSTPTMRKKRQCII